MEHKISEKYRALFGENPEIMVQSPGRINLIGEHTDYNGGWVLPAAIDKKITFAIGKRTDENCYLYSLDYEQTEIVPLSNIKPSPKSWVNYLLGVVEQFQQEQPLSSGFNLVFGGDVPLGAGLSSSAAVEAGLAFAINELFGFKKSRMDLVKLAQRAENQFVGVQCGIMDMFASVMGRAGAVMRLDCRSLDFEYFPFDFPDVKIVLCDTGVKHSLGDGEYNIRRKQCEEGVSILKKYDPSVSTLRDVSLSLLKKYKAEMSPLVYQRCSYVVKEIARVEAACKDLLKGDLVAFGQKMYETHTGLSHYYEVSCPELDFLVKKAKNNTISDKKPSEIRNPTSEIGNTGGVFGSRMMGGGFGGCTINLVKTDAIPQFIDNMAMAYFKKFKIELKTYVVTISDGTRLIENI
jgi:galactokinase